MASVARVIATACAPQARLTLRFWTSSGITRVRGCPLDAAAGVAALKAGIRRDTAGRPDSSRKRTPGSRSRLTPRRLWSATCHWPIGTHLGTRPVGLRRVARAPNPRHSRVTSTWQGPYRTGSVCHVMAGQRYLQGCDLGLGSPSQGGDTGSNPLGLLFGLDPIW